MKTITHIWQAGKRKTPLPLMTDTHIRKAYRLCWYRIYIQKERIAGLKSIGSLADDTSTNDFAKNIHGVGVDIVTANKWIPIFQQEAKRRNLRLVKPTELLFERDLKSRNSKRQNALERNKKFDEQFK